MPRVTSLELSPLIRQLREAAGLTQAELAERIGTTQSVISRLESDDYDGHSLSMLSRIGDEALDNSTLDSSHTYYSTVVFNLAGSVGLNDEWTVTINDEPFKYTADTTAKADGVDDLGEAAAGIKALVDTFKAL